MDEELDDNEELDCEVPLEVPPILVAKYTTTPSTTIITTIIAINVEVFINDDN